MNYRGYEIRSYYGRYFIIGPDSSWFADTIQEAKKDIDDEEKEKQYASISNQVQTEDI